MDYVYEINNARRHAAVVPGTPTGEFIDWIVATRHQSVYLYNPDESAEDKQQRCEMWTQFSLPQQDFVKQTCDKLRMVNGYAMAKELHPIVVKALTQHVTDKWFEVALSCPHISATDSGKIDYYRTKADILRGRVTTTTIGKYLKIAFQDLPDHEIRNLAALFSPDEFKFLTDGYQIVDAVQNGPRSCMKWGKIFNQSDWRDHPYACYAPENGWSLAVRVSGGNIEARCLCHSNAKRKIFVRSFGNALAGDTGHSQTDTALEAWLIDQGYTIKRQWDTDCQIETFGNKLFPYIDGEAQSVDSNGYIHRDAEYKCDNQDGTADNNESAVCDHCGDRYDSEEEGGSVGYHCDSCVCQDCLDNHYCYVKGKHGDMYFLRDRDAVEVAGEWYDPEYLGENDIVELANGDLVTSDDAVYVEAQDAYYHVDDVVCDYHGEWQLIEFCVTMEDGEWSLTEEDTLYKCCIANEYYNSNNGDPEPVMCDDGVANPDNLKDLLETQGQMVLALI